MKFVSGIKRVESSVTVSNPFMNERKIESEQVSELSNTSSTFYKYFVKQMESVVRFSVYFSNYCDTL